VMSILMLACAVVQPVFVHLAMDGGPRDSKERNGAGVITAGKVERPADEYLREVVHQMGEQVFSAGGDQFFAHPIDISAYLSSEYNK